MIVRTTTVKLIYKGKTIKQIGTTDKSPEYVIKGWRKLYPKHLFSECEVIIEKGKEYNY